MKKGFTLVELLGVILIIALLSIVMFPNVIGQFFRTSEQLDEQINKMIIEAAKDYYLAKRDDIGHLDYCINVLTLQEENLLAYDLKNSDGKIVDSKIIVKIGKNGSSYTVNGVCNVSESDITQAAKSYYQNLAEGESRCITISELQNSYYLSRNITNGSEYYNANTSIRITNNGLEGITAIYNENC